MDIILHGSLNNEDTAQSLASVLQLLHDRYHINSFREIHLEVTLVDDEGNDVELMNNETNEVYRIFEVRQQSQELSTERPVLSSIHLVVDNTHPHRGKK
ncbi:MAG: hypothetical protein A3F46_01915 [Legionellales bacterium RIFCSPHIGHO2_12_FULL_42_9]|nr:MAG: hypothetical protein A3F46_01915 [Legionellales bacterium RIFCSPHIGHO2_12_FULL_42_9]